MNTEIQFSNKITALRKEKKLTQKEVAAELGIKQRTYASYEECRCQPKMEVLRKLADYFKLPVDALIA